MGLGFRSRARLQSHVVRLSVSLPRAVLKYCSTFSRALRHKLAVDLFMLCSRPAHGGGSPSSSINNDHPLTAITFGCASRNSTSRTNREATATSSGSIRAKYWPLAKSIPRLNVALTPWFLWLTTRIRGSCAAYLCSISRLASVEPSLMVINSKSANVCFRILSIASPRNLAVL